MRFSGKHVLVTGAASGLGLAIAQAAQAEGAAITAIGHMGTGEAQSSYVGFDPGHGTAVAVMMNTATPGPQAIMGVEALTAVSQEG